MNKSTVERGTFPPEHTPVALDNATAPDEIIVSAMLWLSDGRYLLQLRDDKPGLPLRDHWAMFGGHVEPDETPDAALPREIEEELAFRPPEFRWYHETLSVLPRRKARVIRKVFYLVPITLADVAGMVQSEGADMRLFTIAEMLALPNVAPWDLSVMMMHAREKQLFAP